MLKLAELWPSLQLLLEIGCLVIGCDTFDANGEAKELAVGLARDMEVEGDAIG